jgi:hypothetical protein
MLEHERRENERAGRNLAVPRATFLVFAAIMALAIESRAVSGQKPFTKFIVDTLAVAPAGDAFDASPRRSINDVHHSHVRHWGKVEQSTTYYPSQLHDDQPIKGKQQVYYLYGSTGRQ